MPDLSAAAPAYAKDGSTAFLGVDTTEAAPIVRAYGAAKNVTYPLAIADDSSSFAKDYDIVVFPTTFVIDPRGVIRARYTDVLARRQIEEIVAAGKAQRNAAIVSPLQSKIDALLLDPAIVFTSGDPATIEKQAKAAQAAIASAEKLLDQSDAASGNSTDFDRTRAEEATLRDKAIAALVQFGTSVRDTALLPELSGDAARDRERWSDAAEAYRAVLLIDPKNEDALDGLSYASHELEQYPAAVDADAQLVALEPESVTALVRLALDQAKAGRAPDSYASFARAVALAKRHVDVSHGKAAAVRSLAYAHLYAGRTYAKNGDSAAARAQFDEMLAWSEKLPRDDERHDMYLEEGQEAIAALELGTRSGISVSLAPWTGSDLPGSIPNTFKYRLVLAGGAGTSVTLRARGVPKTWVASFCSDKICAPMQVGVAIPESGVKVVEFQLVPPGNERSAPKVQVTGSDGRSEADAST
jgi:tetratricopeptide (TPR) repeat protein